MKISACISVDIKADSYLPDCLPIFRGDTRFCANIPQIRATEVAVADGVATITIPATPVINSGDVVDIQLFTSIPDGTDGAQLVISNGTTTVSVMNGNGNYLRFYPLTARTVLRVQYLNDPAHFQIINVFGRAIRRYK